MDVDRMKRAIFALFKASVPRLDYYASYRGSVVQFNVDDQSVDVNPDDPRIPPMGRVPFRHGAPAMNVDVSLGTSVLIGWSGGDPSQPFAESWGGGETVKRITLTADQIILGGDGAEPAVRGQTLQTFLNAAFKVIGTHTHPVSGAVAGPSPVLAPPVLTPPSITATKVKVV